MTARSVLCATVLAVAVAGVSACSSGTGGAAAEPPPLATYVPTAGPGDPGVGSSPDPAGMTTQPGTAGAPSAFGAPSAESAPGAGSGSAVGGPGPGESGTSGAGAGGAKVGGSGAGGPVGTTSGNVSATDTTAGTTVWPTRPTVTLAPSLVVSMSVAPGVDTTGIDIDGAKAAYYGLFNVIDQAIGDPAQDWGSRLSKYASGSALMAAISEIKSMADRKVRAVGHSTYEATATKASTREVQLRACNDVSRLDIVLIATGESVGAPSGNRHPQDITVANTNGMWRVSEVHGHLDEAC